MTGAGPLGVYVGSTFGSMGMYNAGSILGDMVYGWV